MSVPNVYQDSIVIDLVAPILATHLPETPKHIESFRVGGVTVVGATVAIEEDFGQTVDGLTQWHAWLFEHSDRIKLIRSVADIEECKARGITGIIFHFQNSVPFGTDLRRLALFHALGVRVIQLCYNRRNFVGDGCTVAEDAGLSDFGRAAIAQMNRLGIVVDLSHTGKRTTLEALEIPTAPAILSHSNISELYPSKRNIDRTQVRALAKSGGVIGLNGCEYFIKAGRQSTVDDLVQHADFIAEEIGTDYISLGIDHFWGHSPHLDVEKQQEFYSDFVSTGRLDPATWPEPPQAHAKGIEIPEKTAAIAETLLRRGYSHDDLKKILGGNLMRVFSRVWNA